MILTHTNRRRLAGAAIACPLFIATIGSAQFAVDPAVGYAAAIEPSGAASADFNGDGFADIATTVGGPDRIVVHFGSATGVFTPGPSSLLPASSSPSDLVAGRLDADTDIDLAVALRDDPDPQGTVRIMLNDGSGSFSMGAAVPVGDRPRGLAIADMEPDGDMDLAVVNRDSNSASVLTNSGAATFTVTTLAIGGEPRAAAFADIDSDNDQDVVVTNHGGRTIMTFSNNGGSFTAGPSLGVGPFVRPDGIAAADLDNDGDVDLAAAASDDTLGIAQVNIYINSGGTMTGPFPYDAGAPAADNTSAIVVADLDCDGLLDVATANSDSNNISMLRNLGAAVFGAPQIAAAGTNPDDITAGDFDGDGDADLATANRDSNNVSVFINQTCTVVPGDVDGDGDVDFQDLLALLAAWGMCGGCPADFDGNGLVDFNDLLTLLANWTG